MWPYAPYSISAHDEAKQALIRKDQCTETALRNSISLTRGNAKYLIAVVRSSQGPQFTALRREILDALHLCRIECRISAWALRLKRMPDQHASNESEFKAPLIEMASVTSDQSPAPRAARRKP